MKRTLRLALSAAAAASVSAIAGPALAWDSICYTFKDPNDLVANLLYVAGTRGCEGIEAARGRWRDIPTQIDEHRRLFELGAQQAGLPKAVWETQRLAVLTNLASVTVQGGKGPAPTIDPLPPMSAQRAIYRAFALDELAQLPDFSFNLWDLLRGNETCPLNLVGSSLNEPQRCHAFKTHMGATNSNHFPPQSDGWYAHYHDLAKARADECNAARLAVWSAEPANRRVATDSRLAPFFRACEVEALAYEAVAQHFLQDSWSAGHMWQRWGSTDLSKFPILTATGNTSWDNTWNGLGDQLKQLLTAEMVAIAAGTIHGSDAGVIEALPPPFSFSLHDAMCYPTDTVRAMDGATPIHVVGDVHLHDVVGGPPDHASLSSTGLPYDVSALSGQQQRLMGCVSGSIAEVYAKFAGPFGAPALGAATAPPPPNFSVENCRALRETNSAIDAGIDYTNIQLAVGQSQGGVIVKVPDSITNLQRNDYGKLRAAASVLAKNDPDGTYLSTLRIPQGAPFPDEFCNGSIPQSCFQMPYALGEINFRMMQTYPNRCYDVTGVDTTGCGAVQPAQEPPSALADRAPSMPLNPHVSGTPDAAITLAFHTSRAAQMCDQVTAADLTALQTLVTNAADADTSAACEACAEWTAPFLRVGQSDQSYDTTAQPLCYFHSQNAANLPYVYEAPQGTADTMSLARHHCGCRGLAAATDAGLTRLVAKASGANMSIARTGPTIPVGNLPRDVAAASDRRLLVGNGQGQIVGVRDDAEVDLDGNAMNGITRLTFAGVSDVQALTVVNMAGKELVLAVTVGTGELIAWDLTNNVQCDRFTVAQVAGQGAYDVLTTADGTTAFVSLRKSSPLSGAVAVLNLPAIAQCNGSAVGTIQWIATPGAVAGLGPMALSPDGTKLAVGGRFASTCLDQIRAADAMTNVDTQVGCDRVFVMDVASKTWLQFGANLSMPTRPGRFPYGVAWFGDSARLAYASFQGIDNLGNGDSGWPANFSAAPRIPVGGTLRIADTSGTSFTGGGGATPRYWSYNMPLNSYVGGPTVVVDGGANAGPAWVFVGTTLGRISAFPVAANNVATDPWWEGANADPETSLHMSTSGAWYGGCSHSCSAGGTTCPMMCPGNVTPGGYGVLELGSNIRALVAY